MRLTGKLKYVQLSQFWSLIVEIDNQDLSNKYLRMLKKNMGIKANPPSKSLHVTVITTYETKNSCLWRYREGDSISIEYKERIRSLKRNDGKVFYYVDVEGQELNRLRLTLGFDIKRNYHITVAEL